jgi:YebC/PmpR family DNA-binding regulatory protein
MAGHSKWANIKHRKSAQDAKRGKLFTKLLKEITVAARTGGGDPAANPRLNQGIEKAKAANVPKDNIDKAVKRGTGELEGVDYEEYTYEGYAPGGVAILVEVLTDNKNRTGGEVRSIFTKNNGNMAEAGAVAWNFERKGLVYIANEGNEDKIMESAIEFGADDVESDSDYIYIYSEPENFEALKEALQGKYPIADSELTMVAKNSVQIEDKGTAEQILKLIDKLEDNDDVQKVYANFEMDEDLIGEE